MKLPSLRTEVQIALWYAIFGILWILLSDRLLAALIQDPAGLTRFQTVKGWFFVTASTVLIYILLQRSLALRTKTEDKLRSTNDILQSFLNSSLDAFLLTRPDGTISSANPAACQILGRSEAEICEIGRDGLLDPTDSRLQHAIEVRNRTGKFVGELNFVRKNGESFPCEVSSVLFYDQQGNQRTSIIVRDITQRKQAEKALLESEERYRNLLEAAPVGIAVHSGGKLVFSNPAGARLLGARSADELVGLSIQEIIAPEGLASAGERIRRMLDGEKGLYPVDDVYRKLDGTRIDVEVMATALVYLGKPAVQVIVTDITERKRVAAELQASHELLRQTSARLAELQENERRSLAKELHDQVGQSLSALAINLNLILNNLAQPDRERLAARFDSALNLVSEVTDRIRNVMAELHPPVLDDYGLEAALRWLADRLFRQTGVQVEVIGDKIAPQLPLSHSMALFRIAQEALTNVIKYAGTNQAAILLENKPGYISLSISDEGAGFNAFQPDPAPNAQWGLLTMRERAEAMGGTLEILSNPGQGTSITARIPWRLDEHHSLAG